MVLLTFLYRSSTSSTTETWPAPAWNAAGA